MKPIRKQFLNSPQSLLYERCLCQMTLYLWIKCACSFSHLFSKRQIFTTKLLLPCLWGQVFRMIPACSGWQRQWESRLSVRETSELSLCNPVCNSFENENALGVFYDNDFALHKFPAAFNHLITSLFQGLSASFTVHCAWGEAVSTMWGYILPKLHDSTWYWWWSLEICFTQSLLILDRYEIQKLQFSKDILYLYEVKRTQ
jgi:hypothetical protein